jgi:hypothetical protein
MDARVVYLQQILSDTLQHFPSDRPPKLLPHASKIAWIPVEVKNSQPKSVELLIIHGLFPSKFRVICANNQLESS